MRLHPDHLIALAYVARTGSLTQAGKLLGKTQPAVSNQIKQLAEAVGEPLLVRHRTGVTLTPVAEALLPSAQVITKSLDVAEQLVQRFQGVEMGVLRLITSTSVAVYFLPSLAGHFHEHHPSIDLRLIHRTTVEAIRDMERNEADVAIVREPTGPIPANFVSRLLLDDETILAVRPDHPFARHESLAVEDLDGFEMVSQGMTAATRQLVEGLAKNANIKLHVKFEVISVMAIKEAVQKGLGGGFLSRLAIERELKSGELVAIRMRDREFRRPIMLIHPTPHQISPRVRAFLDKVDQYISRMEIAPTPDERS